MNINDIISKEIETLEDEISGNFCECSHELSEHFEGSITGITKCHALIFNGAVFSSCNCSRTRIRPFCIKVMVPYAENSSITK